MNIPVFDLHCDTVFALLGKNFRECGSLKENTCHIDLRRAGNLSGYAQCFACFTTEPIAEIPVPAVDIFERELATFQREITQNSNVIRQAFCVEDIIDNQANGLMSAILTIEGPAGFGYDPELLGDLYLAGFRMSTLGWNENNPLTGSCLTGGPLTDLGREYVHRAQSLGMVVDVSHISDEGFWDIIKITRKPVIASHSNSRAVCDVRRNLSDDMFRAICDTDGVAGINLYSEFLGDKPTLDTVCDHIFHFMELDPEGTHISLGGDLDGCELLPEGFSGIQDYRALAQRLEQRGLNEKILQNIFWDNALGVMKRCSI